MKIKVLVVDDSAIMLRTINLLLKEDYDLKLAMNGKQAVEMMMTDSPDVVILDYEMPGINGEETFDMLNKINNNNTPIIFLTGVDSEELSERLGKKNPADYLVKPPTKKMLDESIRKALIERGKL